jgi:hypothetical protein
MKVKLGGGRGRHKSGPTSFRGRAMLFRFLRPLGARLRHDDVVGRALVRRFLGETLLAQAACLRGVDFEPLLAVARDIRGALVVGIASCLGDIAAPGVGYVPCR